jgi:hypothetical protein
MRVPFFWALVLWPALAVAADLGQVDRTIRKEPVYRGKPHYCLLVFGPRADTRVWLVLDLVSEPWDPRGGKDVLYVDRNGTGDLTEQGKRVAVTMRSGKRIGPFSRREHTWYAPRFAAGAITERDGRARHTNLQVDVQGGYVGPYRPCQVSLKVAGRGRQVAGGNLLRFGDRPQDAPVIHFNGPLVLRPAMETGVMHVPNQGLPYYEEEALVRGRASNLYVQVGTPGLGRGTFVPVPVASVPNDRHPVAELVFPGDKPQRARVVLQGRC